MNCNFADGRHSIYFSISINCVPYVRWRIKSTESGSNGNFSIHSQTALCPFFAVECFRVVVVQSHPSSRSPHSLISSSEILISIWQINLFPFQHKAEESKIASRHERIGLRFVFCFSFVACRTSAPSEIRNIRNYPNNRITFRISLRPAMFFFWLGSFS